MAFIHGKSIFVMLNGYNITGYLNKIDTPYQADTAETSVFGNADKSFIAGMKNATLSGEGLFDGDADAVDEQLDTILSGSNITNSIMWFPAGNTLGNIGYGMEMIQTAYAVMGTKDDAVKISLAGQSNVGRERLKLIKAHAEITNDGTATVNNNGAATANGGAAYLELSATNTDVTVIIEHSSDNFAADTTTLASFTKVTSVAGIGHQRVAFAGAVKQYTRVKYTFTGGTGIATFAVGLCRK